MTLFKSKSEGRRDVDVNNPPQGSRASSLAAHRTLTLRSPPRPAWQLCCLRVVTCQILMNLHCVLCFSVSCMTLPPLHHHPSTPVHDALAPPISTHPSPPHPLPGLTPVLTFTDTAVCVAAWPVAPLPLLTPGLAMASPPHPRTTRARWARRSSRPA